MAQNHVWFLTFSLFLIFVALFLVFADAQPSFFPPGNNGNGNGNENGNGRSGRGALDAASTNYIAIYPIRETGQERALCLARGRCFLTVLRCPAECPQRKPRRNKKVKGCFIDCSSRCETTCKKRKPNCNGYGSICYDPRFVGGDGVMFYFHGAKGRDFALVSDDHLQINAHFIGIRPRHRSRDFTWVQSLALMFGTHTLVVAAAPVAAWDDRVDALRLSWDDQDFHLPLDVEAEWRSTPTTTPTILSALAEPDGGGQSSVVVERVEERNSVRVRVEGVVEIHVKVVPVTAEDDRVHGYGLPDDDAFAHLEMQFKFGPLSVEVEGVLGRTYRPGFVSPVKRGVAMPVMGGEDKYLTSSLLAADCAACRFERRPAAVAVDL